MRRLPPAPARVRPAALAVVLLVLSLVVAGCGPDHGRSFGDGPVYVALGDSYTAAPGIAPVADPRCGRSKANYPSLVAKALKVSDFHDRSCSAATTADLTTPQSVQLVRINGPQLDAVDKDTTLVTIGMGLNNLALSVGLLLVCLTPPGHQVSSNCQNYLSKPESAIDAQIHAVAGQVGAALEAIRTRAPRARIVLVGYPRLMPDSGSCPDRMPMPEPMVERLRDAMRVIDEQWKAVAEKAGATYVDMYTPSKGHDICSDDAWINGYRARGTAVALHPFAAYEKAVADHVVSALRR